ncbi:c-type cytochrome [Marinobacterium sp. CAU 1594]|nr:c-type cytochrome [Marinobacterium arenosum]
MIGMTAGLAALVLLSASAQAMDAEAVFKGHCEACHTAGLGGAPKPGDKAAWAPRLAKGLDALTQTVLTGKGAMPPKGTCMNCDEGQIKAAVQLFVDRAQ